MISLPGFIQVKCESKKSSCHTKEQKAGVYCYPIKRNVFPGKGLWDTCLPLCSLCYYLSQCLPFQLDMLGIKSPGLSCPYLHSSGISGSSLCFNGMLKSELSQPSLMYSKHFTHCIILSALEGFLFPLKNIFLMHISYV